MSDDISQKLRHFDHAVGWWGGKNIHERVHVEQIAAKIRVLLQDKLMSRGKDVFLWSMVSANTPGVLPCSCVKETANRADNTCSSCYGAKFIPGYLKFAHETLYLASVDPTATLNNVSLDYDIKPSRIALNDGVLTGTITSVAIPYDNHRNLSWEFHGDGVNVLNTNTISYTFSTDNIIYYPISQINDLGKQPIGIGNIYLQVILTRVNLTDRSPYFEILRIRHPKHKHPYIKILRPWVRDLPQLMQYGLRSDDAANTYWTAPLDFFDHSIPRDTPACRILERSIYQRIDGIDTDHRYIVASSDWNEQMGLFSWQHFTVRRVQPEEVYQALVF